MRVKNRVTAADGGDGRQYGIDAVEGGGGIGKRQVIGKAMDLPARRGFGGQPFGGAGGAADLPAGGGKTVPERASHITKSKNEDCSRHGPGSRFIRPAGRQAAGAPAPRLAVAPASQAASRDAGRLTCRSIRQCR